MYKLASHPQSILQILPDSFKLYKAAFARLFFWAIVMGGVNFLSTVLTSTYLVQENTVHTMGAANASDSVSFALMLAGVILLSLLPVSAMMFDIYQVMHQQKPTLQSALMRAVKAWLPLIAALIVCSVILSLFSVMILLVVLAVKQLSIILAALCGAVLLIGLIYVMVCLFAWYPLIITERQRVFSAFKNSFKLIYGNWWRTFLLLLIVVAVTALINVVIDRLFLGTAVAGVARTQSLGQMLCNVFATVIFIPWLYAVILLQIHNLKLRKQKVDTYEQGLREYDVGK